MSDFTHHRARVANTLVQHGAPEVWSVRPGVILLGRAMAAERAALGLPPLSDRLQVALSAALVADSEAMAA